MRKFSKKIARNILGPRHIFALVAILLVCCAVFLWVGAAFLPAASQKYTRQIVCDDYDTLTTPLKPGGAISQTGRVEGKIYGIRANVATSNQVVHGTLRLQVLNTADQEVTRCVTDMTELLDNTFHLFLFEAPLEAGEGGRYTFVFTIEESDAPIAFHKSAGPAENYIVPAAAGIQPMANWPKYSLATFALAENGESQAGTLALQYVVRYAGGTGGFLIPAYTFFAVLFTVFLMALYTLIFIIKWPVHRLFVVCTLVLGLVFSFLIPLRTAPDEYVHIATAYQYSNVLLGQGNEPLLTVRAGDEMYLQNYDFSATDIFAYQDIAEGLFERAPEGEPVQIQARTADAFPLMYAAPTAGVLLARLLGLGRVALLLLGRWANLIFYTVLVSRAIKRMPLAKPMLFCAGLLPSVLQLAASFSYDAYAIALAFYITAYTLQLALSKERATIKQLTGLGIAAALLAPAKAVYVLLLAVLFFIPAKQYAGAKPLRVRRGFLVTTLACALMLWAVGNWGQVSQNLSGVLGSTALPANVSESALAMEDVAGIGESVLQGEGTAGTDSDPEAWSHSDGRFTPSYILKNLPQTASLLMNSLRTQSAQWLQELLGGRLGESIAVKLEVNWLFTIGLLGCLIATTIPTAEDSQVLQKRQRLALGGITAAVALALLAICMMWTPTDYESIFGMQGRYLLPVLPPALLAARSYRLKWGGGYAEGTTSSGAGTALVGSAHAAVAFTVPALAVAIGQAVFIQVLTR